MSAATDEILEKLKGLSLLEASELVKQIEEAFGVSAAAPAGGMMMPMAMAGIPGAAAAPVEEVEEKTEFDVILEEFPADKKIAILKEVRTITGLGLKEAKELVESVPKPLKTAISQEEANSIKKVMEGAGAKVSIK